MSFVVVYKSPVSHKSCHVPVLFLVYLVIGIKYSVSALNIYGKEIPLSSLTSRSQLTPIPTSERELPSPPSHHPFTPHNPMSDLNSRAIFNSLDLGGNLVFLGVGMPLHRKIPLKPVV